MTSPWSFKSPCQECGTPTSQLTSCKENAAKAHFKRGSDGHRGRLQWDHMCQLKALGPKLRGHELHGCMECCMSRLAAFCAGERAQVQSSMMARGSLWGLRLMQVLGSPLSPTRNPSISTYGLVQGALLHWCTHTVLGYTASQPQSQRWGLSPGQARPFWGEFCKWCCSQTCSSPSYTPSPPGPPCTVPTWLVLKRNAQQTLCALAHRLTLQPLPATHYEVGVEIWKHCMGLAMHLPLKSILFTAVQISICSYLPLGHKEWRESVRKKETINPETFHIYIVAPCNLLIMS